ncbi:MAG TPA: signal peptidase I [Sulfurimonas sp.]|nr:signal peptidase I [Sulfurimonas sp.]
MKKKVKNFAFKAYKFSNSWTGTVIIVLLVIFFVAQAFRIPSGSMKSSLLIGDHLFAKKFAYGISTPHLPFFEIPLVPGTDGHIINGDTPERGDIVIFRFPQNPSIHFVKRCVGLPGDILFLNDKDLYIHMNEGDAYIKEHYNKEQIIETMDMLFVKNPYQKEHPGIHHDQAVVNNGNTHIPIFYLEPVQVPENEYFMMGDNRDHSNDSRFWGTVPYGLIEGTPWFIYFSINDNYEIRWDRMGKTPTDLEGEDFIKRALAEDMKKDMGIF